MRNRWPRGFIGLAIAVMLVSSLASVTLAVPAVPENYLQIHYDSVVVDTHNDTMMHIIRSLWLDPEDDSDWLPYLCLSQNLTGVTRYGHVDIPKLQEGGIDVPFFAAFVAERYYPGRALDRQLALMNALYWTINNNPETMALAKSVKEMKEIVKQGKIAAVLTIEAADPIRQPYGKELLRQYFDLGVRAVGITWNDSNELAEGISSVYADGTPSPPGLTEFGREMVEEMNRLGIVIDVSHIHENSFWDIIAISEAPIMASHSCAYALRPHARNLTDEQIMALAENGGVIQITFVRGFLAAPPAVATVETIVDHIDHVVGLVGVDYVGLGSDFDGATMPVDLADASEYPEITEELLRRGYSKSDIEKILGGNTLRVWKEVEKVALRKAAADATRAEQVGVAPQITPMLQMGQIIEETTPLLAAKVERARGSALDTSSFRVVLDGNVCVPDFNAATSMMLFQVTEPLAKGFHIVTFEAANRAGKTARSTIIFHVRH